MILSPRPRVNRKSSDAPKPPRDFVLAYAHGKGVYLNLTNRCPTACVFCLKRSSRWRFEGNDLRLPRREPTGREALRAAHAFLDRGGFSELVFCGYGESTYALFEKECARCHTLARAVNSPVQSRLYWRFHLVRMSLHSRLRHEGPISPQDMKAILDFLEYDAQIRKMKDKKKFDEQTEELQRRFEPILKKLLDDMRQSAHPNAMKGPMD